jgi:hypothetical protein
LLFGKSAFRPFQSGANSHLCICLASLLGMSLFQLLLCLAILSLSMGSLSYREIEESFQHNLNILETYISRGLCQHFYIDMGTNIGIQLRKLYEPHYFPGAQALPTFDMYFGNEKATNNRTRSNVCSIGFEPNHVHFDRLNGLQNKYRMAGYPMVIFINGHLYGSSCLGGK